MGQWGCTPSQSPGSLPLAPRPFAVLSGRRTGTSWHSKGKKLGLHSDFLDSLIMKSWTELSSEAVTLDTNSKDVTQMSSSMTTQNLTTCWPTVKASRTMLFLRQTVCDSMGRSRGYRGRQNGIRGPCDVLAQSELSWANEGAPAGRVGLGKSRGKKILNLQGCPLMLSLPVVATSQIPKGLLQRPIEAGTTDRSSEMPCSFF